VKFQPLKQTPALIALGVIALVSLLATARLDVFERLEHMTYDWRARVALRFPSSVATNLGFVAIGDQSITALKNGSLGFHYGLYWPRHIYGRVLRELSAQGAPAVAFDVLFDGQRPDHPTVPVSLKQWPDYPAFHSLIHPGQTNVTYETEGGALALVESDDFFAWQLHRGRTALLAVEKDVLPYSVFEDQALAIGDIAADKDPDGVLRRARAFQEYRQWHPAFRQVEADEEYDVDLNQVSVLPGKIILHRRQKLGDIEVPVDAENNFDLSVFYGSDLPAGMPPKAKAFTHRRVWHMGILLAARSLHLDLDQAVVDLAQEKIMLRSTDGVERVLPVDRNGFFYINWEIPPQHPALTSDAFENVLRQDQERSRGQTNTASVWKDKFVVIGSNATGNDLTDHGTTPLEKNTLLVSKHWNVANSIITGRFIQQTSLLQQIGLIALLGIVTAIITWRMSGLPGLLGVMLLAGVYLGICVAAFVLQRLWLPLVLPLLGVVFIQYGLLVAYRVVFEQREQRRVKGIFSKVVSPNVARELLGRESLALSGERTEVTVLFADVREFTEMTDRLQEQVTDYVRTHKLDARAAEAAYNESARETLNMVNAYLALVADVVKQRDGTLDKYIGDCVMAFWGAPTPQPNHAVTCVRAAMEAQRAIQNFNARRAEANRQLEIENVARVSASLPPKPLLPTLSLGTGINTGIVTVGLMGSNAHILNYTVFGREVNLASRLESVSGHGRIVIGEGTYAALQREDPALAKTCVELEPTKPKGFQKPVRNFEVPWQTGSGTTAGA
jgi:class 3 adenylate cyclase/CHASE2 domain-containing sensor protein